MVEPSASVVMVHGASNDHTAYALLARWCAHHGYAVLAVDAPGGVLRVREHRYPADLVAATSGPSGASLHVAASRVSLRTPAGRAFVLRVPEGGGPAFAAKLGQLKGDWDTVDTYVARYGERFEDIATQFGISRQKLRALNDLDHDTEVTGGTVLVVPRVAADVRKKHLAAAADELYGSGVDHRPGEALIVAVPDKDAEVAGARRVFYRVVAGDELGVVARAMGRTLTRAETVHHVDHNPTNNALANLLLFATNRDHKLFEARGTPVDGGGA